MGVVVSMGSKRLYKLVSCFSGLSGVAFKVFFILGLGVSSELSWAQSLEDQRLASQTKFNFLNDLTLDSNVQKKASVDNNSGLTYTFGLKYKIDSKNSIWAFARAAKRLSGEERFDLLDTIVRYERSLGTFMGASNRFRLSAVLPTNEHVHETTSFNGALSGQLRSGLTLRPRLYLTVVNTLRWNFHRYRVSEVAGINIQSTLRSSLLFSYTLNKKVLFSSSIGGVMAKTYKNKFRNHYNYDVSASYNLTNKATLTAGLGTSASATKADGRSSNIRLFDERDTSYYLSLSHFY